VIHPVELVQELLAKEFAPEEIPGGVLVGPAGLAQQRVGCVAIVDTGVSRVELTVPTVRRRFMVRCIAGSIDVAERISALVDGKLPELRRRVVKQTNGESYLVHSLTTVTGPSLAQGDIEEVWVEMLQVEAYIGTQQVL
jgi:hypothetical protein